MKKQIQLQLPPEIAFDDATFHKHIKTLLSIQHENYFHIRLLKRSIDARGRSIKVNVQAEVYIDEKPESIISYSKELKQQKLQHKCVIIGAGPAGLFAALRLLELGIQPIIIERGKDVQLRRRDLANINKHNIVNENSNYCFGEGGAGTYSDGKLYTRSKKRGDIQRILEILVAHGAPENILFEAHPHIGTNKLPKVIEEIRTTILQHGGEIHFNTRVSDFKIEKNTLTGVWAHSEIDGFSQLKTFNADAFLLATGHSARDIFELLQRKNVQLEAKPFALGVRIEHQQSLIDNIQYHGVHSPFLPPASYSWVEQIQYKNIEKAVFSFCMCPGGFIVPSATQQNEIVVNGMSPSRRDSPFSNSGIVAALDENDWLAYKDFGALAGMEYQREIEQKAWQLSGKTQRAPAQLVTDFIQGKTSKSLLETSYQPGLVSFDMREILPENIASVLQEGLKLTGNKMRGYVSNLGQIVGIESRTSSPVRIPRLPDTLEHVQLKRLFPCGEGAGYAGGIMSAAIDGEKCAEAIFTKIKNL